MAVNKDFKAKLQMYSHACIILTFLVILAISARSFIIPLAFSALLALVLNPLLRKMESWGLPRIVGIILAMLCLVIILGGLATYSAYQLNLLLGDLPSIEKRIVELFDNLIGNLESLLGSSVMDQSGLWEDTFKQVAPFFGDFIKGTSSVATILVQIPIYIFLILLYKEKFLRFLAEILNDTGEAQSRVSEVKKVVQGYVSGLFLVILILAVLNSFGLWALGIKYALFFGIFSAILTVIPYLGNAIGGLLPFLVALVTKDSAWYAVGVVGVYVVIQFLEGNFITPNVMGSKVSVNPLAALIALLIGGQILGIAGIILAIPFLGIIKTMLGHSQTLKPIVILIDDDDD
jgi:predicted PurR-regulated permease PerM